MIRKSIKTEIEFRDKDQMCTYKTRFYNIQKGKIKKKGQYLYEGDRVDISKSRIFDEKSDYNTSKFSVSAKNLNDLKKKLKKIKG
ncbi:hypothetical protein LCGC14_0838270 [marine sediment metagenome]|uniref:Uncharacterized protein n=1 Tax=marine sediment metagenome TaxID=412755 RepID=A0A0F9PDX1_9ZZZZ